MTIAASFTHRFVEYLPNVLEEGILYVSIRFRTASHLCACGCEYKVVTPLSPARWLITYNGASVTLSPSIGNWQAACRSHYLIIRDKVHWAKDWSEEQVEWASRRDARELLWQGSTGAGGSAVQKKRAGHPSKSRRKPLMPWRRRPD
ncbi:DUF6527 family protein [Subtercola boreus]|uniref:DUF6527 family protein n=1 Tax=Subtercola boreus TaxID=120213 RepID=UPI0011C05DC1|nr:DUF6527 family protein [Subtercola boreus]